MGCLVATKARVSYIVARVQNRSLVSPALQIAECVQRTRYRGRIHTVPTAHRDDTERAETQQAGFPTGSGQAPDERYMEECRGRADPPGIAEEDPHVQRRHVGHPVTGLEPVGED
jgi:hypothetical protein